MSCVRFLQKGGSSDPSWLWGWDRWEKQLGHNLVDRTCWGMVRSCNAEIEEPVELDAFESL